MPQPNPTPDSGKFAKILQILKDHWLCVLLILVAFVLGLLGRSLFGF